MSPFTPGFPWTPGVNPLGLGVDIEAGDIAEPGDIAGDALGDILWSVQCGISPNPPSGSNLVHPRLAEGALVEVLSSLGATLGFIK